jgi:3-methyl-2-oxobutanoate hydroxymethyltransferase
VNKFEATKFRVKPRKHEELLVQAQEVQRAGAFMLVLRNSGTAWQGDQKPCPFPRSNWSRQITDGQVLVYHDLLGYNAQLPKFVKRYAELQKLSSEAIQHICRK